VLAVLGEALSQHTTGRARAHDDEVKTVHKQQQGGQANRSMGGTVGGALAKATGTKVILCIRLHADNAVKKSN
jgi:hypothetical protein